MTVFCTYCSAQKDDSLGELPSIQRYQSQRIKSIYHAASHLGLEFLILSGKYGILQPSDPILYYDHRLQALEVSAHANKVAGQLKSLGVKDMIFFSLSSAKDKNLKPYIDCIKSAADHTGVELKIVILPSL